MRQAAAAGAAAIERSDDIVQASRTLIQCGKQHFNECADRFLLELTGGKRFQVRDDLRFRQAAFDDAFNCLSRQHRLMKFSRIWLPSGVPIDSGWNCTP